MSPFVIVALASVTATADPAPSAQAEVVRGRVRSIEAVGDGYRVAVEPAGGPRVTVRVTPKTRVVDARGKAIPDYPLGRLEPGSLLDVTHAGGEASKLMLRRVKLLAGLAGPPDRGAKTELDGIWRVIADRGSGATPVAGADGAGTYEFREGTYQADRAGEVTRGTIMADPFRTPKVLDLVGKDPFKPARGVYELRRDELTICLAPPGSPRPARLTSAAGSGYRMITMRRTKPPRP